MKVNAQTEAPAKVSYWWEWLEAPNMEAETMFASLLVKYQADRGVVMEPAAPVDEADNVDDADDVDEVDAHDCDDEVEVPEVDEKPTVLVGAKTPLGWTAMAPFEYSWDGMRLDYA